MLRRRHLLAFSLVIGCYVAIAGCGDDDTPAPAVDAGPDTNVPETSPADTGSRSPEFTGSACTAPTECYVGLDAQSLKGAPRCLDRVTNGYCTHTCSEDSDCCAVEGECRTGFKQVCATFESTGEKYCFLSCEATDIAKATDAGVNDAGSNDTTYCQVNASTDFTCRSSGGGSGQRKVCVPAAQTDGGPRDASFPDGDAALDGDAP